MEDEAQRRQVTKRNGLEKRHEETCHWEKRQGKKGTRRKAMERKAMVVKCTLENNYVVHLSTISMVPFLPYERTPNPIVALNAIYFRCRKRHCAVPFLVPLKSTVPTPLEGTGDDCFSMVRPGG
jgi:hypothetical protein